MTLRHPQDVLFAGEKPFPILPVVDHYAGSEKLMLKALQLQHELGPVFDLTCDCEDGAKAGTETAHATMAANLIVSPDNRFGRVGARVHDITHDHWQADLDILVRIAGRRLAFLTLPKVRSVADAQTQIAALRRAEAQYATGKALPVHDKASSQHPGQGTQAARGQGTVPEQPHPRFEQQSVKGGMGVALGHQGPQIGEGLAGIPPGITLIQPEGLEADVMPTQSGSEQQNQDKTRPPEAVGEGSRGRLGEKLGGHGE